METILKKAKEKKIPVFSTYLEAVEKGAMAGNTISEFDVGQQTAEMLYSILIDKTDPSNMPVRDVNTPQICINKKAAQDFEIEIPRTELAKMGSVLLLPRTP